MKTNRLANRALELFSDKNEERDIRIKFSKAFKGYNANCTYNSSYIEFRVSAKWKDISEEIFIGLLQELLNKIYKDNRKSYNIELYNNFIKNSTSYSKVERVNKDLKESFDRVNNEYFSGMINIPNLVWSKLSLKKLGGYDFMTNTISISPILKENEELLDYVMYHEILHKKMQFKNSKKNKLYHTSKFKEKEKEFKIPDIEKKLESFLKKKKLKRLFSLRR